MDTIRAYADRVRRRFDLFDPVVPIYQVATLRSLSGGGVSRPCGSPSLSPW